MVFNELTDVNTKGSSLFLVCCSLSLQKLNFVGKQMKISVHYASNGFPCEISLLWQTSCWFSWWFLQMSSQSLNIVGCPCRSWPTNTSCFPELFKETPDCEFAGEISPEKVPPELSLSEDYRFRCKLWLHNLYPLLHSVSGCWIHWCFGIKNIRLYLWLIWKWEIC